MCGCRSELATKARKPVTDIDIEDENANPGEVTDDGLGTPLPEPFTPDEVDELDTRTPEDI